MSNKKKKRKPAPQPAPAENNRKEKIPMRSFSEFFSLYYSNMPKVLLCDLLFAIPVLMIAAGVLFQLPKTESYGFLFLIIFAAIVLIYILYAGVNSVMINIMDKKKNFSIPKTFFTGIVKYSPKFLAHSLIVAVFCFIAYSSFAFYSVLARESAYYMLFYIFYAVYVYIMIFIVSHFPLLTIKFNCTLKEIYGTSIAMIPKNGVNNLSVAAIITMIAILSYIFISLCAGIWYLVLLMAAALLLIFPAFISLLSNFLLYDRTKAYLEPEDNQVLSARPAPYKATKLSSADLPQSEYVFYNGKIIKKEQLEKELAALEEQNNEII